MRIIFMGTSCFAVPSLHAIAECPQHDLIAVVTQPDRPHGRGGKLATSPVKDAAQSLGIQVLQPERVRRAQFFDTISHLNPEALVVAAFGQIIPQRILDIPRFGGINVHGSLLPRWRGAAPMQYSLMAGDRETGVTTMQMDAGMDTGDILLAKSTPLSDEDNVASVEKRLAEIGAEILLTTLTLLELGECPRAIQDETLVTLCPPLAPDIGQINWNMDAERIHNLVRGLTPRPGTFTFWAGKRLKIHKTTLSANLDKSDLPAGSVQTITREGITITTGCGQLLVNTVQPEGKPVMPASDWARGARLQTGTCLDTN